MENQNNLTATSQKHFSKMYKDSTEANKTYQYLLDNGYTDKDINIVMSDATRDKYFNDKDLTTTALGSKAAEGMGIGGVIGGSVGAVAAAIAAIGTVLALPGLGIVIAGPLAASFAGAGAGGALGTLIGGLTGAGIPNDQAAIYENDIKEGGVLISVKAKDDTHFQDLESKLNNI